MIFQALTDITIYAILIFIGFVIGCDISRERLKNEIINYLVSKCDELDERKTYIKHKYGDICASTEHIMESTKDLYKEIIMWLNDQ